VIPDGDWPEPTDAASAARLLTGETELLPQPLLISANGLTLVIRSNSQPLLERLAAYFAHLPQVAMPEQVEILAVERPVCDTGWPFIDWRREPGKSGRKDAWLDLPDGRLLHKVRTGMLFLQSEQMRVAAGPCLTHDNQLINFINSQLMNRLQQRDWLICHAAALGREGSALALAGFSGGGKSTLMLRLLESPEFTYLTNDRLFLRTHNRRVEAVGIPKLPRINPGTLINNPRLAPMLSPARQQALRAMPLQALWDLEEKHDVDVAQCYGAWRIDTSTPLPLETLVILNWAREADEPTRVAQVDLPQRRDLLPAVMKSPGPFYQDAKGRFQRDDDPLPEARYLQMFESVKVFEVAGRIDFDRLVTQWPEWVEAC
jgi:HprK-related kinase B